MSRHRNIRSIDVDEEYEGYYSCYGHSVEDDSCISPQTEAQFIYKRPENRSASLDLNDSVPEEEIDDDDDFEHSIHKLNTIDATKLQSCVEAMQNVVGDTISEAVLQKAAFNAVFDLEKALHSVLSGTAPSPQSKVLVMSATNGKEVPEKIEKMEIGLNVFTKPEVTSSCSEIVANINKSQASPVPGQKRTLHEISQKSLLDAEEMYKEARGKEKVRLNLVVIGHVDAGKSTLMGHALFKLGQVPQKSMHKFEQESKKIGKASFMYAWVLDETPEERNRGITMDIAQTTFQTNTKHVVVLDAPGHRDFIPNMITGAAQADVAILVVDSTRGEFETGFEDGGQTKEHTMLIRSLGVLQLIVAVNKMDNVNWSKERFQEIKIKLTTFLRNVGFKECDVTFVPCSGLTGDNLIEASMSPEMKWYHGPTIIEAIDKFQAPERSINKKLRISVKDVFKGISGGLCIDGKVQSGYISTGEKVLVMPSAVHVSVKVITMDDQVVQQAFAGESIILQFNAIDINNVSTGSVICDIDRPIQATSLFEARLVIFNVAIPITRGFPVVIHYQSASEQAVIRNIISQLHRSTGEVIKRKPRCLTKHTSAIVEIEVNRPICIEIFKDFKNLGRFMLRYAGSTVAAGLVTALK